MFYRPSDGHGLPHNPFNAIITPRPIGWISSRGRCGDNLAPYSFFNAVAYDPPQVMFASTGEKPDRVFGKDSTENIRETGVFCVNVVETAMRDQMNVSSGPFDGSVSEFKQAGIESCECETISCLRVAHAPANLECKMTQMTELAGLYNYVVFAEVIGVHLRDDCLSDGRFDILRFSPLGRLGYLDYCSVTSSFSMVRNTG
ncbi:MAG: flavin reductase family protein [Rhodobacteraceae bacterium]|nr:flavin reductase family protein [Paracoccaceae bacterium]MCY4196673.1 flavin reductase family protein [Paracoccaceae bacterium]MCY4328391.1 flavin reductase family protein [Paracoccaceae bacterium]